MWRRVASWTGHGSAQLETFLIEGGRLRLRWETTHEHPPGSGRFTVRVHSADSGRILAEPIDARGVARDVAEVVDEHPRVYLSVDSAGVDWSIAVEEGAIRR
jgi:hypothetical protein